MKGVVGFSAICPYCYDRTVKDPYGYFICKGKACRKRFKEPLYRKVRR
jgi:hypothetical protein